MRADMVNQLVRAIVLLALLGYFMGSIGRGLVEDERIKYPLGPSAGQDPGVRVLLENRGPPEPVMAWDKLDITILQPVDVVTPNNPDDPAYHLTLRGGVLHIQADTNTGLLLSAREWGKDYTWPVSMIRIQPAATDPEAKPTAPGHPLAPARRDPTLFEAADHDAVFGLSANRYRGSLEIDWHSAKDVEVINCLPMETYIEGVVAVEMSPAYPLQALKAQAVVSRSYAYAHHLLARKAQREYDLTDSSEDQEYRGSGHGNDVVRNATFETHGMIMVVDNGSPFAPLFCASSGGYTESIENVSPGATDVSGQVPLKTVMLAQPDRFCQLGAQGMDYLASHWTYTTVIKPGDLQRALARLYAPEHREIGYIHSIRVGKRDPRSQRVLSVLIFHTSSAYEPIQLSGHYFRMLVGPNLLRSSLWSSDSPHRRDPEDSKRSPTYEITSTGYGHGVGMSQISAWEMANQNYAYTEILKFFYLHISIIPKW